MKRDEDFQPRRLQICGKIPRQRTIRHEKCLRVYLKKVQGIIKFMPEIKQTKEQLLKRRDEIFRQLNKVNQSERFELDNSLEEQSIQTEHEQVAVSMEGNLRKELGVIEDHLLDFDSE